MEDQLYKFLKLYKSSPALVKRIAGGAYGLLPLGFRHGKRYKAFRDLARESKTWTVEEHRAYQLEELKGLIAHAHRHVPLYRNKYDAAGIGPEDMRCLEDIQKFPTVTRKELKADPMACLAQNMSKGSGNRTSTSGSTGDPLVLYHQKGVTRPKERAFLQDLFEEFGFETGNKSVIFRGEVIEDEKTPWYYDPVDRQLIMSSYLLNDRSVNEYCRVIRQSGATAIRGYPFTIFRFAQLVKKAGCRLMGNIRLVILESENVYESHARIIREVFQSDVCHYYGHTERLIFGGNCRYSQAYHMHPEYGFFEILDRHGQPAGDGSEGEIIATGFDNRLMPMIRYHTGDVGISDGYRHCECGRNFPVITQVKGREEEYVKLNSGGDVPFHNLIAGIHDETWGAVDALQCVQTRPGFITVKLIVADGFDFSKTRDSMLREIFSRVSSKEVEVSVEKTNTNDIITTRNGKTKLLVQHLNDTN